MHVITAGRRAKRSRISVTLGRDATAPRRINFFPWYRFAPSIHS
jgi:hypothetical protein